MVSIATFGSLFSWLKWQRKILRISGCQFFANKRLRSDDAYTPDRRAGMRPDYPSIVYTKILKELYPDVPVVLGGIEASLRRLSHYDYWQDRLRPGILADSPADLLIYGMGELPMKELVTRLQAGESFNSLKDIRQTVYLTGKEEVHSAGQCAHRQDPAALPGGKCGL